MPQTISGYHAHLEATPWPLLERAAPGTRSFSTPRSCRRNVDRVAEPVIVLLPLMHYVSTLRFRRGGSYRSFSNVSGEHKQLSAIIGHGVQTESVHVVRGLNHRSCGDRHKVGTGGYRRYRNDCVGDAETYHVGHLSSTLSEINRIIIRGVGKVQERFVPGVISGQLLCRRAYLSCTFPHLPRERQQVLTIALLPLHGRWFQSTFRIVGDVSFGQYSRSIRTKGPCGAGSQLDSLSAPGLDA
jgi:hypothetical protein